MSAKRAREVDSGANVLPAKRRFPDDGCEENWSFKVKIKYTVKNKCW